MNYKKLKQLIRESIYQISEEQGLGIVEIQDNCSLVEELGFASLDVATLVAVLDTTLGVEPFSSNIAVITEIRTIEDIARVYEKGLEQVTHNN